MTKILFVCLGNICRSPMAEFVFRDIINKRGLSGFIDVSSAATSPEEIGNDIHRGTREKLKSLGIPFSRRAARQMTKSDYSRYDYIIGMEHSNIRDILRITGGDPDGKIHLLLDFTDRANKNIADPWYTGDFDKTYDDILEGCEGLLQKLLKHIDN